MRAASLLVFLALAGSATAAVVGEGEEPAAQTSAVAATGSFSFANSRGDMPIFSATGIAPGDSVSGTVEIANTGAEPGQLVLTQHDVEDTPGPGGGELSERLSLRITDVTVASSPVVVYVGPLAPMPSRPAGQLGPGESRAYEFAATLPESGPGGGDQNDVQGASTSVAYSWTTGEVSATPAPPTVPPNQPPSPSPSSAPPTPASTAAAAAPLRLRITRVRHTIRRGRLLVWARCDSACSISARGRVRARSDAGHRAAKLRPSHRSRPTASIQRLRIRIPRQLRRWIETNPSPIRLKARLFLLARNQAGERATTRRTVRVRTHRAR